MTEIPIYFIIHHNDSEVITYRLKITNNDKCFIMLERYSEICSSNEKEKILEYATGLVNVFLGNQDKWYRELIQKYIIIDLSDEIASLEEINNNNINSTYPSRIYFVDFVDFEKY